ncbi:hypothetical protein [Antarctobacter jejuensis]|uniref:hypothetical protein n=1 Tax=Antarctobacter jejuensis TaxID=1439938 RepID=UPI003FD06754
MRLFNLTRWPTLAVFLLAGCTAAVFAFVTVNLFSQAMASLAFIRKFGWEAIRNGALWQVGELAFWGAMSLSCWLVFKICEHLLADRYLTWARRPKDDS